MALLGRVLGPDHQADDLAPVGQEEDDELELDKAGFLLGLFENENAQLAVQVDARTEVDEAQNDQAEHLEDQVLLLGVSICRNLVESYDHACDADEKDANVESQLASFRLLEVDHVEDESERGRQLEHLRRDGEAYKHVAHRDYVLADLSDANFVSALNLIALLREDEAGEEFDDRCSQE